MLEETREVAALAKLWDAQLDRVGPRPGYLMGGPEPSYNWASECPTLNAGCSTAAPSPPTGQPDQKSYTDFNGSWPIDSWEVTELQRLSKRLYPTARKIPGLSRLKTKLYP